MNYINPDAPAAGLTRLLNMRDNNPATQLAYVPTKDIAAMGSMGGLEFNPYSGIPQARGIAAVADGGSIQDAPLAPVADELASRGRYGDSMLLHVRPDELQGLASLGTLTINPDTGLPEAFSFKSLLPAIGAIGATFLLGPTGAGLFGGTGLGAGSLVSGALGTGIAAGLGGFAGGLIAGQSPGQAALGGLMSGATSGFMAGLGPTGTPVPGVEGAVPTAGPGELGTIAGFGGAGSVPTAAGAADLAAAAAIPTTPANAALEFGGGMAGQELISAPIVPAAETGFIQGTIPSNMVELTKPYEQGFLSRLTGPDISKYATDNVIPKGTKIPTELYRELGGRTGTESLGDLTKLTFKDPKTYIGAGISTMLQPPPEMEYQEPEPLELGPSYVPRERTLAGGTQSPARSSEEYLRMALEGGYQPLSEQYRYAAQGGLVGLVEGGTPEQGALQSQLSPAVQQPSAPPPVLQQQEQQISERARQDKLLQRDQAMSRGQQFIEQPTGNQQLFQQMQNVGQVIGQQLAQGPESYATPPGQSAAPSSFVSGTSFGFNAGGLVGLAEGGEVGNSIAERRVAVRDYLKSKGLRDEAVAGIMGNIEAEAPSYKHDQIEKTKKKVKGYGLFQFTGPRKTAYFNWLEKNNQTDSAKSQIDYVMDHIYDTRGEMDKSEYDIGYGNRETLRDAFKDGSVEDISKKFMLLFERPKDQSKEKIEFRQEQALNAFGRIPEPDKVSTPKAIASAPPQVEEESTLDKLASFFGMGDKSLKVGRGDNLSQIAEREGVSVRDIAEASGIQDINKIQAGQELTIPSQGLLSILGFAQGGDIGQYFEGQVVGNGDGMSDQILFEVEGDNPDKALLSRDEYVIPADVVAMLGNGSSNAGSDQLDNFIKGVRQESFGTQKQQRQLNAQQGLRGLV